MPRHLSDAARVALDAQHGVITRQQLLSLGVSDRTISTWVRRGHLHRIFPGCFAETGPWREAPAALRHTMQLLAVQMTAPDVVARGATAALTWRLPVRSVPILPLVIRQPGHSLLATARVERRELQPNHVVQRGGLTMLTMVHTIIDVAAQSPLPDALITVDAALRRGLRRTELLAAFDDRTSFPGRGAAVTAVEAGDPASESPLESLSRGRIIERGLPLPLCNVVVRAFGRSARVDKLWVEDGVVGEADGHVKYSKQDASMVIWKEKRRREWLEELGLAVARWGMPEVGDDGAALERRYRAAAARQRAVGFTWPLDVTLEVPRLRGAEIPPRVLAEVERLAAAGYPIRIFAMDLPSVGSSAVWTPQSA